MTLAPINSDQLFEQLGNGSLLLTANNRLAKRITDDYSSWQASLGRSVWPSPQILPLGAWHSRLLEKLIDQGDCRLRLLTAEQESLLWQEIIRQEESQDYLMPPASIARNLLQAWQLYNQWHIDFAELEAFSSTEVTALRRWIKRFQQQCQQANWLSRAQLSDVIVAAIARQQLRLPENIVFSGFEDFNRQQLQLIEQLQNTGCRIARHVDVSRNHRVVIRSANCFEHELELAATSARERLLADPACRIGIVIPTLQDNRKQVDNCFQAILHPERSAPPPWRQQDLYNISLGQPLSDYPLVHDALLALGLLQRQFTLADLSNLLLSPFVLQTGTTEDALHDTRHAQLDLLLRRFGRKSWSLQSLSTFLNNYSADRDAGNSSLQIMLQQLIALSAQCPTSQSPQQWSLYFLQVLHTLGWPGSRPLDSHEFQQQQRFQILLGEFRQLHLIRPRLSFGNALTQLRRLAADCIFQAQSSDTRIQISGMLEASGQQFDYLWICGLDDEQLPARAQPNPLLPVSIQRQHNLPHCSAEREFDYASRLLQSFADNSTELVCSYAVREADRDLRPSPLLGLLFPKAQTIAAEDNWSKPFNDSTASLQAIEDRHITVLPPHSYIRGGSALLTAQANCPFRAVAEYRLQAEAPEQPADGVDARDRGSQVHNALEQLWQQLGNQQQLLQLSQQQLENLVGEKIGSLLETYRYKRPDLYRQRFLQLEQQRLTQLLLHWLELEKQRPATFSVVEQEQDRQIAIGGLLLKTKVDRIDELADGSHIIIDYKTGASASSQSWTAERISEPQLPLYSLAETGPLMALTLAQVNEAGMGFKGLAREDNILPGIKAFKTDETFPDWQSLQQHWHTNLAQLAEQFRQGRAEITPLDCQYCPYPALCRKHELQEQPDD